MIDIQSLLRSVSLPEMFPEGSLRSAGSGRFKTKCPFHADTRPSMVVNLRKNVWWFRCWVCGASGNAINYVMLRQGVTAGQAMRLLAAGNHQRAAELRDYGGTSDSEYILVCDGIGCGVRVSIDSGDKAYVGYTTAVAWAHKDGKSLCPRCVRKQGESSGPSR